MMKHDDILNMKTWQQCEINAPGQSGDLCRRRKFELAYRFPSKESGQEAPSRKPRDSGRSTLLPIRCIGG